jgi:hypothetical protein
MNEQYLGSAYIRARRCLDLANGHFGGVELEQEQGQAWPYDTTKVQFELFDQCLLSCELYMCAHSFDNVLGWKSA